MSLVWLPNALTIARCGLAVFIAWLILSEPRESLLPLMTFVIVALTDFLDGWLARALNATSEMGAFLDPVADKLLVACCLFAICYLDSWSAELLIPVCLIVIRDISATGLRLFPRLSMPVSVLAKWKTALEMIGIGGLLLAMALPSPMLWVISVITVWLAAILSVYTLWLYLQAVRQDTKRPHP